MYSLAREPELHRVELRFSGQMTQDAAAFFDELTTAAKCVRSPDCDWSLLVDFSDTPVMTQERANNTTKIFDWCMANGIAKIAFVLHSSTQRMQVKRVTRQSPVVEVFDTRAQAEAWLATGIDYERSIALGN